MWIDSGKKMLQDLRKKKYIERGKKAIFCSQWLVDALLESIFKVFYLYMVKQYNLVKYYY